MNGSAHCSNVSLTVRGDSRKRKRKISFRVWMIPPFGWQFYLPLSPHGRNGKVIIARKECHGSDEQRNIDSSVCKILQEFCNTKWFQVSISEEQKVGPGLIFQSMSKSTALIENTFYVHIKSGQNNLITMLQMQAWQTECRCVFRNDAARTVREKKVASKNSIFRSLFCAPKTPQNPSLSVSRIPFLFYLTNCSISSFLNTSSE